MKKLALALLLTASFTAITFAGDVGQPPAPICDPTQQQECSVPTTSSTTTSPNIATELVALVTSLITSPF